VAVRESTALSSFAAVTREEIHQLVLGAPCKTCELDPVPTAWLVKRPVDLLAPVVADICNASLQSGYFPASQKQVRVSARLKKPSLDPDDLNSFRPIPNLTFLSKIVERTAARQFVRHADDNHLLPPRQSVYRLFQSTESALLAVYYDTVQVIDAGHVVELTLLDLSSAFDSVDHSWSSVRLVPILPLRSHSGVRRVKRRWSH